VLAGHPRAKWFPEREENGDDSYDAESIAKQTLKRDFSFWDFHHQIDLNFRF
jgi:hypothetical protein